MSDNEDSDEVESEEEEEEVDKKTTKELFDEFLAAEKRCPKDFDRDGHTKNGPMHTDGFFKELLIKHHKGNKKVKSVDEFKEFSDKHGDKCWDFFQNMERDRVDSKMVEGDNDGEYGRDHPIRVVDQSYDQYLTEVRRASVPGATPVDVKFYEAMADAGDAYFRKMVVKCKAWKKSRQFKEDYIK